MDMIGASFGIAMLLIVLVAVVVPYIFYLITLQKAFKKIRPAHRKMEPGLVWLSLIPLVGIVWQFFVVTYLADGLAAEFKSQGKTPNEARPGYGVGLAKCICGAAGVIPGLGTLTSIAFLVLWIIHWVRIHNYSQQLDFAAGADNVLDQHLDTVGEDF